MSARDLLADARALLGAASSTSDPDLRLLYVGRARSMFAELQAHAAAFGIELDAVESTLTKKATQ